MNPSEKLQELFLKFPGIGPKQAARFVYYLLRTKNEYKSELAKNIEALKDSANICKRCLRVYSNNKNISPLNNTGLCDICANPNRDNQKLMIIVKELDIDAIEKTGFYNGKYFVLGNVLPFLTEKPSEVINIRELVNLIHNDLKENNQSQTLIKKKDLHTNEHIEEDTSLGEAGEQSEPNGLKISEIIFALPATDEGENTINYLKKTLSQIVGIAEVKMSTLARGLSTGLDIEYVDKNTFKEAFTHRG